MVTATQKYKKNKSQTGASVATTMRETMSDPDAGLELTENAKKRLRKIRDAKTASVPLSVIRKKYY